MILSYRATNGLNSGGNSSNCPWSGIGRSADPQRNAGTAARARASQSASIRSRRSTPRHHTSARPTNCWINWECSFKKKESETRRSSTAMPVFGTVATVPCERSAWRHAKVPPAGRNPDQAGGRRRRGGTGRKGKAGGRDRASRQGLRHPPGPGCMDACIEPAQHQNALAGSVRMMRAWSTGNAWPLQ